MSLIFMEGCDDGLWSNRATSTSGMTLQTSRTGSGSCIRSPSGAGTFIRWTVPAAQRHATWIIGYAWKPANTSFPSTDGVRLYGDNFGTAHIALTYTTNGQLQVTRGLGGTQLGITNVGAVAAAVWHFVELYVYMHDTAGIVKLRVDGSAPAGWSDLTNVDTKNGGTATVFDTLWLGSSSNGNVQDYDDIYILTGDATTPNDLIGDCRVRTLLPNGNGSRSEMLGSDGNSTDNYLLVDESTPNTSDYVASAVPGTKDLYAFADLSDTSGIVYGVTNTLYAAKSDSGSISIRSMARRAGSEAVGSVDHTLTTSYAPYDTLLTQDPTDVSPWSIAKVNAMEFGAEVRA